MGRLDEAMKDYTNAIKDDKSNETAFNNRAFLYNNFEKYDLAILDCNAAIELMNARPNPYCHRSLAYANIGK